MSRRILSRLLVGLCAVLVAGLAACDRPQEQAPAAPAKPPVQSETPVRVPASVAGQWKAVKIVAINKETRQERLYTVDLGGEFSVPGTGLIVKVNEFLPEFVMDGKVITSASNELSNPAVHVHIIDHGEEVYRGWLFSLYPEAHTFQHDSYGFVLVDFVPIRQAAAKKS